MEIKYYSINYIQISQRNLISRGLPDHQNEDDKSTTDGKDIQVTF